MSERLLPAPNVEPPYLDLLTTPYRKFGRCKDSGLDCYGLVEILARRIGMYVPDYSSPDTHEKVASMIDSMKSFWEPCEEGAGAVAVINIKHVIDGKVKTLGSHTAMVLNNERLIHAWEPCKGIVVEPLSTWRHRIAGFYLFRQ